MPTLVCTVPEPFIRRKPIVDRGSFRSFWGGGPLLGYILPKVTFMIWMRWCAVSCRSCWVLESNQHRSRPTPNGTIQDRELTSCRNWFDP